MSVGSLVDEERMKLLIEKCCAYCGKCGKLTVDHLISKERGGSESADNIVWACRSCNSSKGAEDVLVWYCRNGAFPPLLLLRRYLKLAFALASHRGILETAISESGSFPIKLSGIPVSYPPPGGLRLWALSEEEDT